MLSWVHVASDDPGDAGFKVMRRFRVKLGARPGA